MRQPLTTARWFLVMVAMSFGIGACSEVERDAATLALTPIWIIGKIVQITVDDKQAKAFDEEAQRQQPHPERIPASVTERVDAMETFPATTIEGLLDVTGLAPYRNDLFIFRYGTLDQTLWIYYRADSVLTAKFNPFTLQIEGPIRKVISSR